MSFEPILTQYEVPMNLSLPAMRHLVSQAGMFVPSSIQCEIDNFCNVLLNLIERGVDRTPAAKESSWLDE